MSALYSLPKKINLPVSNLSGLAGTGSSSGGSSKKKKKKSAPAPSVPALTDEELIRGYTAELYAGYEPQQLTYEKTPENTLKTDIASWLRPAYDQAIKARQELTKTYGAELDADAISRGMGASTYVTDVKARQGEEEADDIAVYETTYAAELSKYLSAAVEKENDRAHETMLSNTERNHEAYMAAYGAALQLFQAYKAANPGQLVTGTASLKTLEDCEGYVSELTEGERKLLYDGADGASLAERNQMISNIGATNFLYLQQKYPGA